MNGPVLADHHCLSYTPQSYSGPRLSVWCEAVGIRIRRRQLEQTVS